jgi:hypothetical protein
LSVIVYARRTRAAISRDCRIKERFLRRRSRSAIKEVGKQLFTIGEADPTNWRLNRNLHSHQLTRAARFPGKNKPFSLDCAKVVNVTFVSEFI